MARLDSSRACCLANLQAATSAPHPVGQRHHHGSGVHLASPGRSPSRTSTRQAHERHVVDARRRGPLMVALVFVMVPHASLGMCVKL